MTLKEAKFLFLFLLIGSNIISTGEFFVLFILLILCVKIATA